MIRFILNYQLLLSPFPKRNRFQVFLIHWIAWLLLHFITFLPSVMNMTKMPLENFFFTHIVLATISFLLFYIVAFTIIPRMATRQTKWFWVLIASLLLAIIATYLKFLLETYWDNYLLQKGPASGTLTPYQTPESVSFFSHDFRNYSQLHILTNVSVVIVGFAYRLLLGWFQQEKARKDLQTQMLQAELSFLKMQVNPHFLFNALNNIYSLAVIENSKKTGNSILKLSEIIRYMLYEKEDIENKVSLDKEIRHINSYIDLEKLRHEEDIYLNFSIEGETADKKIAPLLLFPLIENACKHGVLNDHEKPIDIQMKVEDHWLTFTINNCINDNVKDESGGIGLPNVQKRLDLIYGNDYTLDINKTEGRFSVNLRLPL